MAVIVDQKRLGVDVIRNADWIIDLAEGGSRGGRTVFEGTPRQLLDAPDSRMGKYLRRKAPVIA